MPPKILESLAKELAEAAKKREQLRASPSSSSSSSSALSITDSSDSFDSDSDHDDSKNTAQMTAEERTAHERKRMEWREARALRRKNRRLRDQGPPRTDVFVDYDDIIALFKTFREAVIEVRRETYRAPTLTTVASSFGVVNTPIMTPCATPKSTPLASTAHTPSPTAAATAKQLPTPSTILPTPLPEPPKSGVPPASPPPAKALAAKSHAVASQAKKTPPPATQTKANHVATSPAQKATSGSRSHNHTKTHTTNGTKPAAASKAKQPAPGVFFSSGAMSNMGSPLRISLSQALASLKHFIEHDMPELIAAESQQRNASLGAKAGAGNAAQPASTVALPLPIVNDSITSTPSFAAVDQMMDAELRSRLALILSEPMRRLARIMYSERCSSDYSRLSNAMIKFCEVSMKNAKEELGARNPKAALKFFSSGGGTAVSPQDMSTSPLLNPAVGVMLGVSPPASFLSPLPSPKPATTTSNRFPHVDPCDVSPNPSLPPSNGGGSNPSFPTASPLGCGFGRFGSSEITGASASPLYSDPNLYTSSSIAPGGPTGLLKINSPPFKPSASASPHHGSSSIPTALAQQKEREAFKPVLDKLLTEDTLPDVTVAMDIILKCRDLLAAETSLVTVKAPCVVVGDIHGQLNDLRRVIAKGGPFGNKSYLFLGDYVDRGTSSVHCMLLLACAKIVHPTRVFLLRGNHESKHINAVYGFLTEIEKKYPKITFNLPSSSGGGGDKPPAPKAMDFTTTSGNNNNPLFVRFNDMFRALPLAAIVDNSIFCVHGGLSRHVDSVEAILCVDRFRDIDDGGPIADLTWSDPAKIKSYQHNWRGSGCQFGADVTLRFVRQNNLRFVCRAHQCVKDGYQWNHENRLVTIFSATNYCALGNNGAIMHVDPMPINNLMSSPMTTLNPNDNAPLSSGSLLDDLDPSGVNPTRTIEVADMRFNMSPREEAPAVSVSSPTPEIRREPTGFATPPKLQPVAAPAADTATALPSRDDDKAVVEDDDDSSPILPPMPLTEMMMIERQITGSAVGYFESELNQNNSNGVEGAGRKTAGVLEPFAGIRFHVLKMEPDGFFNSDSSDSEDSSPHEEANRKKIPPPNVGDLPAHFGP